MNRSIRQAVASLRKARSAASWVTCLAHVTYALRQLDPQKDTDKAKATRARKRADTAKERAERAEASRKLRADVFARPGFDCEMGAHNGMNDYMQLCHLKAGHAKRALQKVSNCVRGCAYCHARWHNDGPEEFRANILALCAANDYPVPSVFLREPRAERAPKAVSPSDAAVPRRSANV